jgi:hypothetical protein
MRETARVSELPVARVKPNRRGIGAGQQGHDHHDGDQGGEPEEQPVETSAFGAWRRPRRRGSARL